MSAKFDFSNDQGRYAELKERRRTLELEMESLQEVMVENRAECAMYEAEEYLRTYKEEGLTKETHENILHLYGNYLYSYDPDNLLYRHDTYEGRALEVVRELGRVYEDVKEVRFDPKTGVAMKHVLVFETNMEEVLDSINSDKGNYPRALDWPWPISVFTPIVDDDGTKEVSEDTVLLTEDGETTLSDMISYLSVCKGRDW